MGRLARAGARVGEVAPLFPRIDKAKTMAEIEKEMAERKESGAASTASPSSNESAGAHATQAAVPGSQTANEAKPAQPPMQGATEAQPAPNTQANAPASAPEGVASFITIDDFVKVEMRVGEILT